MLAVVYGLASAGLLFIIDSSKKAAEEKVLEEIVKEARARAKRALDEKAPKKQG